MYKSLGKLTLSEAFEYVDKMFNDDKDDEIDVIDILFIEDRKLRPEQNLEYYINILPEGFELL